MDKDYCKDCNSWSCPNSYICFKDGKAYECWKLHFLKRYLIREFSTNLLDLDLNSIDRTQDINELQLLKTIKDSVDNNKPFGCYMYGNCGIGKTHRAICYCNTMNKKHSRTIAYIYVSQMLNKMKQNFDGNSSKNETMIQKCIEADILVLDDLGQEATNKWWYTNVLLVILNARSEANKPVIVISNLTPKQLRDTMIKNMNINKSEEIMIDRILSRLTKCCEGKLYTWQRKDRRLEWDYSK